MTRSTTTTQPKTLLMILQSLQFIFLRPEADLISNCGHTFKKMVSLDHTVQFIDEKNFVTYVDFDFGINFYPESSTNSERSTENGKTILDPVKNPNASQETINITVLYIRTYL